MCPQEKALISSDENSSRVRLLPPPRLTVTRRGTCKGMANFCRRMQFPGMRGLHISRKELSPLSLGQTLHRETPSSCWAISFQLCLNMAVYSFMKAALTASSPPLPPTCSSLWIPDPRAFVSSFPGGVLCSTDLKFGPSEAGRRAQLALVPSLAAVPSVGQSKPV